MKASAATRNIRALERALVRQHEKLAALKRRLPPEPVSDYRLQTAAGAMSLSSFFGEQRDLVVVHNMGTSCRYCTLWADGFTGLLPHLENRAAFLVVSPDPVAVQRKFAASRGWTFAMASGEGSTFNRDMGFQPSPDEPRPGVSTFRRTRGRIARVASAPFGPFDPFCSAWHFFALLADGVDDWQPQYRY